MDGERTLMKGLFGHFGSVISVHVNTNNNPSGTTTNEYIKKLLCAHMMVYSSAMRSRMCWRKVTSEDSNVENL